MAFNDDPIVDIYSESSEESVLAVKTILTQKRGFICRDESPDKGVDLNVELIDLSKKTNTGQKFPIQIKSIQNVSFIDKGLSLTYVLKTSRIGFFSRIQPTYGIFIFYDVQTSKLYFDYTEKIIERLDEQKSEDWRDNENVSVNIPTENVLDENSVKEIYITIKNRFDNANLLIQEEGEKYKIPSFGAMSSKTFNLDNFINKIENLGYGYLLFNKKRFDVLEAILDQLSRQRINNSPTLLLLAFISYCELGRGIDAKYFYAKSKNNIQSYDDVEKELFVIYELKLKFIFGELNIEDYINGIKNIKVLSQSKLTKISLQTVILQLSLMSDIRRGEVSEEKIMNQLSEIDSLDDVSELDRHLLKVYFTDSIHYFISFLFIDIARFTKTQRLLNFNPTYRQNEAIKIPVFNELIRKILVAANDFGKKTKNTLLQGEAIYRIAAFLLETQINLILLQELDKSKISDSLYFEIYNLLVKAIDFFKENDRNAECHKALCRLYELKQIYSFFKESQLGEQSDNFILQIIKNIESEHGLPEFHSLVTKAIDEFYGEKENSNLQEWSEDEMKNLAKHLMVGWDLPERCYDNLYDSIINKIFFEKNNKNKRYQLRERTFGNKIVMYSEPIKYIIFDVETGLISPESYNVKFLMQQYNLL